MGSYKLLVIQILLMVAVVLLYLNASAQDRHLDTLYSYQPALMSNDDVASLTGGGSYINNNPKTALTDDVMLYPYWQQGVVNFANGKQAKNMQLKFNLLKNELYFNNEGKLNLFADAVQSFSIFDTSNQTLKIANFSNDYPRLGRLSNKTYYLVLTTGPGVHLLKYIYKKKQEIYEYSAPAKIVYPIVEEMLVYDVKSNTLKYIKNNLASLQKALPEYAAVLQQSLKNKNDKKLSDQDILDAARAINNVQ